MSNIVIARSILANKKFSIPQKINSIKQRVEPGDFKDSLKLSALFTKQIDKDAFFFKLEDIKTREAYKFTKEFKREYKWLITNVERHFEAINNFIKLKHDFEDQILSGEYERASCIILEVEELYGITIWGLECSILLKELTQGTDANWSFLSECLTKINNPFYEFIVSSSSKRIETDLSYESFLSQFQNDINNIEASLFIKDFFVFKNFNLANYDYEDKNLESVIYVSNIFSVIDQYLILIDVIVYLISTSSEFDNVHFGFVNRAVKFLNNDFRLKSILNLLNKDGVILNFENDKKVLEVSNKYYHGDYEESFIFAKQLLQSFPSEFDLYLIYCKSLIKLGKEIDSIEKESIQSNILIETFNLLTFSNTFENSFKKLLKYSIMLMNFNIGKQIFGFLSEISGNKDWNYLVSLFSSSYNSPKIISFGNIKPNVLNNISSYLDQVSFQAKMIKEGNITPFELSKSDTHNLIMSLEYYYANKDYLSIIESLEKTEYPTLPYYIEQIDTYLYYSYIHLEKIVDALKLFSKIFFSEDILFHKIEYLVLFNKIKGTVLNDQFTKMIEYPILFAQVVKEYDLYEAFDTFIDELNVQRISELDLEELIMHYGKNQVIFLLNKVSTIETLKYSTDYASVSEVEDERIYILNKLILIDPKNITEYQEELDDIYRSSSVRKVLKEVDEGRLHIDIKNLTEIQVKKFKDDFKRFKEIESSSFSHNLIGFNPLNTKNWERALLEGNDNVNKYNSADYLAFKNIYLESRENFLFSKEYGLDSCLSTRIRHGSLKNHIRSVFEKLNLVTSKTNDKYQNNVFWEDQLSNFEEINSIVQEDLKEFSKQIDEYNTYIVDQLIQITTEKIKDRNDALFAFNTNDDLLFTFYTTNKEYFISVDKTIETILNTLVTYTQFNVQEVLNNAFTTTIPHFFQSKIEALILKFRTLNLPNDCQLLACLSKSSTDIQNELEYLSEWFFINTTSSSSLLLIDTILEASINLTNRINPLQNLKPDIKIHQPLLGYSSLIFVFNILLKNVIQHSNLSADNLQLKIEIGVNENLNCAFVKFTNNLNSKKKYELNIERLQVIKDNWNNHDNIDRSNIEGESGYDKIKRILLYEAFAKTEYFEFSIDNNLISTTIFFPYTKPLKDYEDINN